MRLFGKLLLTLVGILVVAVVVGLYVGPREPVDRDIAFAPASLPEDLDAYLASAEAHVPNLREGAERRIVWAGEPGVRTPLSVVYLHGFSAAAEEIRPVPDRLAEGLGANLYFDRLSGHGRDSAAMAEPSAGDWIEDMAEAVAIGKRLGERVILVSTSTGGPLAAIAATDPALSEDLAGVVFVSPNFAIARKLGVLLTLPWARTWLPMVAGAERDFTPRNEGHARHWTTDYPTVAALPMAALVKDVRSLDYEGTDVPALFVYSEYDRVVSPAATGEVYARWGGPKRVELRVMGPEDDRYSHVIAGDIMSPGQTEPVSALMLDWARGL